MGFFKSSFSHHFKMVLGGWNNFFHLPPSIWMKLSWRAQFTRCHGAPEKKWIGPLKTNALDEVRKDPPASFSWKPNFGVKVFQIRMAYSPNCFYKTTSAKKPLFPHGPSQTAPFSPPFVLFGTPQKGHHWQKVAISNLIKFLGDHVQGSNFISKFF